MMMKMRMQQRPRQRKNENLKSLKQQKHFLVILLRKVLLKMKPFIDAYRVVIFFEQLI
jgi:hypothetical protein